MTVDVRPAARPVQRAGVPLGAVVAIACVVQFMVVLDSTIVTVALPSMRGDLHLSPGTQQWVVTAYLIPFGGLLLLAARAGDLLERRRMLVIALSVFTASSLVAGLAVEPVMLLVARAVQGVGAAALAPASLSLITAAHPERAARARALSFWSASAASAGAAGMVLGGVLTDALSWRAVFVVNVPIGLALILAARRWLTPAPVRHDLRLAVPDAALITAAAAALVYGISQAADRGWAAGDVVAALAAALVLAVTFVGVTRRGTDPLVPPRIYRHRNLRLGNATSVALGAVMVSTIFVLSVYQQQVLGHSPLRTGLSLVPWTGVLVIGSFAARRLLRLLGPTRLLAGGLFCNAASLAWLAWLPAQPAYVTHVLGPTLIAGLGTSLAALPNTLTATEGVRPDEAGLASGLLNTARQIGGALGLAVVVTVAASVAGGHRDASSPAALVAGYYAAPLVTAGISLATALFATLLRREPAVEQ